MKRAVLIIIVMLYTGSALCQTRQLPHLVRVALSKNAQSVAIEGDGLLAIGSDGAPIDTTDGLRPRFVEGRLYAADQGAPLRSIRISAPDTVRVDGKAYHGTIELVGDPQGMLVINELPLETYLGGVINGEISSQWPDEAVKAQAVIARTYAVHQVTARKDAPYQLDAGVTDQVYGGADLEDERSRRFVEATAGEILSYRGEVIQAFYFADCGGRTEAVERVWGAPRPYLGSVACGHGETPYARWSATITLPHLEALLLKGGIRAERVKAVHEGERDASGRLKEIILDCEGPKRSLAVSATALRKLAGYGTIKSTNFEVRTDAGSITISGSGNGHGVGLCQLGARQRALEGRSYREILSYYYPGTALETVGSRER